MAPNADFFIQLQKITQTHEEEGEEERQNFCPKTSTLFSVYYYVLKPQILFPTLHTSIQTAHPQF